MTKHIPAWRRFFRLHRPKGSISVGWLLQRDERVVVAGKGGEGEGEGMSRGQGWTRLGKNQGSVESA